MHFLKPNNLLKNWTARGLFGPDVGPGVIGPSRPEGQHYSKSFKDVQSSRLYNRLTNLNLNRFAFRLGNRFTNLNRLSCLFSFNLNLYLQNILKVNLNIVNMY